MKRNLIYILALAFMAVFTACEDPEYVKPNADRQGIASLTAIFTSGPFVDQQMAKLDLGEEMPDRLVIPVPYYYPVTSDDETAPYMTKVRIQASLAPNCIIRPTLSVLDLTKENEFVFTDAHGNSKNIIITGERVKSDACELLSFALVEPPLPGIINKANKTVSINTLQDLSEVLATFEVSAHATISPDPSVTALNYNEPVKLTVIAHDGVSKAEYTVVKEVPDKLDFGYNKETMEQLFNLNTVTNLNLPAFNQSIAPSMAYSNGKLVVCTGNESAPVIINALTGVKLGEMNLGFEAGSVTNDEAEHLIFINKGKGKETINIYRANSTGETPALLHSFANPSLFPFGSKVRVIGNLDTEALITIINEGISGVSTCSEFTYVKVKGGAVTEEVHKNISSSGCDWGAAPVNVAGLAPRTVNPDDGLFMSKYSPSLLKFVAADGSVSGSFNSDLSGWGLNPNCLDSKKFNNQNYVALFVVSHFPHWGMGPGLYLFNVSDMAKFSGTAINDLACLDFANGAVEWFQKGDTGIASGDVVIAPSADGFSLYIFYYDHNSQVIGGYTANCILH